MNLKTFEKIIDYAVEYVLIDQENGFTCNAIKKASYDFGASYGKVFLLYQQLLGVEFTNSYGEKYSHIPIGFNMGRVPISELTEVRLNALELFYRVCVEEGYYKEI